MCQLLFPCYDEISDILEEKLRFEILVELGWTRRREGCHWRERVACVGGNWDASGRSWCCLLKGSLVAARVTGLRTIFRKVVLLR